MLRKQITDLESGRISVRCSITTFASPSHFNVDQSGLWLHIYYILSNPRDNIMREILFQSQICGLTKTNTIKQCYPHPFEYIERILLPVTVV